MPVGYADGFRRDLTGTEVVVAGRAGAGRRNRLDGRARRRPARRGAAQGDTVTLVGDGVLIEEHARVSGTIPYEIACGIVSRATRSEREVVDE